MDNFKDMTVGGLVDFVITYDNARDGVNEDGTRNATQEDFDKF